MPTPNSLVLNKTCKTSLIDLHSIASYTVEKASFRYHVASSYRYDTISSNPFCFDESHGCLVPAATFRPFFVFSTRRACGEKMRGADASTDKICPAFLWSSLSGVDFNSIFYTCLTFTENTRRRRRKKSILSENTSEIYTEPFPPTSKARERREIRERERRETRERVAVEVETSRVKTQTRTTKSR